MIIFIDSVIKFYQRTVCNSPRQSAIAEAFSDTYLFFSIYLCKKKKKKNAETIKLLGIL